MVVNFSFFYLKCVESVRNTHKFWPRFSHKEWVRYFTMAPNQAQACEEGICQF